MRIAQAGEEIAEAAGREEVDGLETGATGGMTEGRRASTLLDITKLLLFNISVKFHISNIFRSGDTRTSKVSCVVYRGAPA